MLAILLTALLIVVSSVVIGRAAMVLVGWRRPEWLAGAVGLAILVVLAPFLVRLPGRGLTAAVLLALLTIGCAIVTRGLMWATHARLAGSRPRQAASSPARVAPPRHAGCVLAWTRRDPRHPHARNPHQASRRSAPEPRNDEHGAAPRAQHVVALAVVGVVLALSSLPFLFNERTGVLGEGIYTNDHAAQLFWADWLADGFGPQPKAVQFGYPVGPQALAAAVSEGTTLDLVDVFNGLLLAIPALTALAALSALAGLPPWRRGMAAALTGLPYLGASFLAQSGFKETAMALLVVAMAVTLHLGTKPYIRRTSRKPGPSAQSGTFEAVVPPVPAVVAVLAVLAAAAVFTFSIPGAVWFAVAIPVWAILWVGFGDAPIDLAALRAGAARHRRALIGGAVALIALAAVVIGPASGFVERIDDVQESSGRLSSPVFPGEALGIWPEGDFRVVRGEVDGALLASGFAGLCALGAAVALVRRREWALLATLAAAAFVYALSRPFAQIHVEAKALAVLAPIAMLVTLRWLLGPAAPPDDERPGVPGTRTTPGRSSVLGGVRLVAGGVFALLAFGSTLLALRAAPVGFDERQRDLETLAERIPPDKDVVFLGVDRFAGYYLRGTLTRSPGGYVPAEIGSRTSKNWQQGQALDFDTLEPKKLNTQEFAITTAAGYQSTPPPNWREVAREGDYVLWRRSGKGPPFEVLPEEGGDPGAVLACDDPVPAEPVQATTLVEPIVGAQGDWSPRFDLEVPGSGSQTLDVPAGEWEISLQYHAQVPLTVLVGDVGAAELPPSLEGFYLTGAGRGAYWPAGDLRSTGGPVEITVVPAPASEMQKFFGVERRVWLGQVALTSSAGSRTATGAEACDAYVDHHLPR